MTSIRDQETAGPMPSGIFTYDQIALLTAVVIGLATYWAALAIFFATKHAGIDPLPAHSEFFAYSWIYGIRWGAGEDIFQPHSQLIYPIFAAINHVFDLSNGAPDAIISSWSDVQIFWPAFLVALSVSLVLLTVDWERPVADIAVSSMILLTALAIDTPAIFSTAYHTVSLPLAMTGLLLWNQYRSGQHPGATWFFGLGIYLAACALGKPTFVALAIPFIAVELARLVQSPRWAQFLRLGITAIVGAAVYCLAIIAFYHHGLQGLFNHVELSKIYMLSQKDWYDAAKGATPLHWYVEYVVGVIGYAPPILLLFSLIAAWFTRDRVLMLTGVVAGNLAAMFFLYNRSQLFGHQEFIAAISMIAIGTFRASRSTPCNARWFRLINSKSFSAIATIAACVACAVHAQRPVAAWAIFQNHVIEDNKVRSAIFDVPAGTRTIAIMAHPDVLPGIVDAWCRGGSNLFDPRRSEMMDHLFPSAACADRQEVRGKNYSEFNRTVFIRTSAENAYGSKLKAAFPTIVGRIQNCRDIASISTSSVVAECSLSTLPSG